MPEHAASDGPEFRNNQIASRCLTGCGNDLLRYTSGAMLCQLAGELVSKVSKVDPAAFNAAPVVKRKASKQATTPPAELS